MNHSEFIWLRSEEEIESHVVRWSQGACIAIDTEFVRENTYYAKAGLIQLADHEGIYLIDPLEVTELGCLAPLLESGECIKVMHSMSEDIELLYQRCGTVPSPILDTQTAAAFLGYGPSLGYQGLVEKVLGIELDKGETRSDWCKRPLSDSQLAYAAKDAEYLVTLYDALMPVLKEQGLLDAVLNECQFTVQQSVATWKNDEQAYLKLRGAWDLPEDRQRLLQRLVLWRDRTAKSENIPKPWVFSDAQLIDAARYLPSTPSDLKRMDKVRSKSIRLFGETLLELISEQGGQQPSSKSDFIRIDRPIKGRELDMYRKLKKVIEQAAKDTGIAQQLLGSRKMLENIVIHVIRNQNDQLPEEFLGWRYEHVGAGLLATLNLTH